MSACGRVGYDVLPHDAGPDVLELDAGSPRADAAIDASFDAGGLLEDAAPDAGPPALDAGCPAPSGTQATREQWCEPDGRGGFVVGNIELYDDAGEACRVACPYPASFDRSLAIWCYETLRAARTCEELLELEATCALCAH